MKRILCLFIVTMLICPCSAAETAYTDTVEYFVLCKPEGVVNVRERPKLKSDIVAVKFFSDRIISDGIERNGFVHVINLAAEVEDGWIYKGLLVDDEPVAVDMETQVFGGRVACRKYAGGKLVSWLKDGSAVRVLAISHEWCLTERGYIMTQFLTLNARVGG